MGGSVMGEIEDKLEHHQDEIKRMKIDIKMIYINVDYNFNKLSNDIETTTKFMFFRLQGVYWYRFNLDIFTLLATKK